MTQGTHAHVNGIDLDYALHGRGRPPVLLHGGPGPSEVLGQP